MIAHDDVIAQLENLEIEDETQSADDSVDITDAVVTWGRAWCYKTGN